MLRFSLLLLCNSWLKIYDSEPITIQINSTEAQTKNCSENLWCDIYANIWSSRWTALNFSEHSTVKMLWDQIANTQNMEWEDSPQRAEQKRQPIDKIYTRLAKYFLVRRNIFLLNDGEPREKSNLCVHPRGGDTGWGHPLQDPCDFYSPCIKMSFNSSIHLIIYTFTSPILNNLKVRVSEVSYVQFNFSLSHNSLSLF